MTNRPHQLSLQSPSLSGGGGSFSGSIDPNTDRAIASELSRVNLDSVVKARILAAIYHELKRGDQQDSDLPEGRNNLSKVSLCLLPYCLYYSTLTYNHSQ